MLLHFSNCIHTTTTLSIHHVSSLGRWERCWWAWRLLVVSDDCGRLCFYFHTFAQRTETRPSSPHGVARSYLCFCYPTVSICRGIMYGEGHYWNNIYLMMLLLFFVHLLCNFLSPLTSSSCHTYILINPLTLIFFTAGPTPKFTSISPSADQPPAVL